MEDLKLLSLSDLLDLLIEQTTYHTQLISKGGTTGEQFRISGETLKQLQEEIGLRKLAEKTDQTIFRSQDESSLEMAS